MSRNGLFKDMIGKKVHRLLVLARAPNRNGQAWWKCVCDCGKTLEIFGRSLRDGGAKSCGCFSRDRIIAQSTKHGACKRNATWTEYRIWQGMIKRCKNPKEPAYHNYGGRGIKVCDRWLTFENFLADMGRKPFGLTLERKDNNGDYELKNCKWASRKEQGRNTRSNHLITIGDKTQPVSAWCEENGIRPGTAYMRLHNGWIPADAVTFPVQERGR